VTGARAFFRFAALGIAGLLFATCGGDRPAVDGAGDVAGEPDGSDAAPNAPVDGGGADPDVPPSGDANLAPDLVDRMVDAAVDVPVSGPDAGPTAPKVVRLGGGLAATLGRARVFWEPVIAVDPTGAPVVAFNAEPRPGAERESLVQAVRWSAGTWQILGVFTSDPPDQFFPVQPAMALDLEGRPVLAWSDVRYDNTSSVVRVRRWNGSVWEPWDGPPGSQQPSLVVGRDGTVFMAMVLAGTPPAIQVVRREGSAWTPVGGNNLADAVSPGGPRLVSGGQGALGLSWTEQRVIGQQIFSQRRRWENGAWTVEPPLPHGPSHAANLWPAMNAGGRTAFGWTENRGTDYLSMETRVVVFQDGWTEPSTPTPRLGTHSYISGLAIDAAGRPIVLYSKTVARTMHVDRWSGAGWEPLMGALQPTPIPTAHQMGALALDARDRPFVVMREAQPTADLHVFATAD
jgi:hypothetical protein